MLLAAVLVSTTILRLRHLHLHLGLQIPSRSRHLYAIHICRSPTAGIFHRSQRCTCCPPSGQVPWPPHLRGVLTNSGFGTTHGWQLLKKNNITPINCNILKNVLPECNSLLEIPEKIQQFIETLKNECGIVESPKIFELPDHTIHQRHVETRNMKGLYNSQYWGETIIQ